MNSNLVLEKIREGGYDSLFQKLYGEKCSVQRERYASAIERFRSSFPTREEIRLFSASGRTEIGGNHTDHQNGCVLAAAVNLDTVAVVSFHGEKRIRVVSEGYAPFEVVLDNLTPLPSECGSAAIVRGIAHAFAEKGTVIGGFDLYCTSDVLSGSGISSSAAFEILIGTVLRFGYNADFATPVELAKIGQFAENVYFGKKSGLMDQMVSSVGGLVFIDFKEPSSPEIVPFSFDFHSAGLEIIITDTKGSHDHLTEDYVAIREEMEEVASYFGESVLRAVSSEAFYQSIPQLRARVSDRAILRAAHFIEENQRACLEAEALRSGDVAHFLQLVNESGDSSAFLLQNLYSNSAPKAQEIPLAILLSRRILKNNGAVRVHGGGFAGTIQAFVPLNMVGQYVEEMERIFGKGACHPMRVRPVGGVEIRL